MHLRSGERGQPEDASRLLRRRERAAEFGCDPADARHELVIAREPAFGVIDVVLETDAHVTAHRERDRRER